MQMIQGQVNAAAVLGAKDGGLWSIGQTVNLVLPPSSTSNPVSALELELIGSLPVPSNEVPISEILAFKQKRQSLFLEFRSAFEHDFIDAYNSENQRDGLLRAQEKLGITLRHLWKEMEAFDVRPRAVSMTGLISGIVAATTTIGSVGVLAPTLQLALGTAGAFIAINQTVKHRPPELSDRVRDYAYVAHVKKHLAEGNLG